jgi:hypothetical protein
MVLRLVVMLAAMGASSACSADNSEVRIGPGTEDVGAPDAGEPDVTVVEPEAEPGAGEHLCAAAGAASGGGYSVVHCTAPSEPAGPTLSGGGYKIEQGALRVFVPNR